MIYFKGSQSVCSINSEVPLFSESFSRVCKELQPYKHFLNERITRINKIKKQFKPTGDMLRRGD